jgi:prephenate dehydrogenase
VVLAVPLPALPAVLREMAGYSGLITDVTSVKGPVRDLTADFAFVGGHPMAGKETSGFRSADPALFAGCAWVLCLEPDRTSLPDWLTARGTVHRPGCPGRSHDRGRTRPAVAAVSHVPHLLAAALAAVVADDPLAAALAAGSFRDGTRVAGSRPELTAAMCGGNATVVRPALGRRTEDSGRSARCARGTRSGRGAPAATRAGQRRPHGLAAGARRAGHPPGQARRSTTAGARGRLGSRR